MIVSGRKHWYQRLMHPGVALAAPAVILYSIFFVWPAIQAFGVSMYDWTGFAPKKTFIGFQNFIELMYERLYWRAVLNNFVFMAGVGVAMFAFSLLFAAVLSNRTFPLRRFFKMTLFAPYVVSVVAIAVLWTFIYDPTWGLLNSILTPIHNAFAAAANSCMDLFAWAAGLVLGTPPEVKHFEPHAVRITWLGSWGMAIPSLAAVMVWAGVGFYVTLLAAGIDRIPDDLYEAARIDGANEKQNFFYITLPLLREVLIIAVSVHIIGSLKQFGLVWAMTRGTNLTHTMETYMYEVAFESRPGSYRMGYGTSMTVVLFFLVVLLTFTFNRIMRRAEVEY